MIDDSLRVIGVPAPEADVRRGRVRVRLSNGQEDVRSVVLGDAADAWLLWARELRFALDNTRFIDLGDAVYRCETVDRVDPINEGGDREPMYEALQACLGALTVIRDLDASDTMDARGLAAQLLHVLEQRGFLLADDPAWVIPSD